MNYVLISMFIIGAYKGTVHIIFLCSFVKVRLNLINRAKYIWILEMAVAHFQTHVVTKIHIPDQSSGRFCWWFLISTKFRGGKIPYSSLPGTWARGWSMSPAAGQEVCFKVQPICFQDEFSKVWSSFWSTAMWDLTLPSMKQNNLVLPATSSTPNIPRFPY